MPNATILVAAEDVGDAGVVCELLRKEFDQVGVSTDPAKAQSYYLGLYRLSRQAHAHSHRTPDSV